MIFVLILIVWLTIVAIIVNACRSAAHGDEMLAQAKSSSPQHRERLTTSGPSGRVPWVDGPALTGTRHVNRVGTASRSGLHAVRVRGSRCAAGS
jgi:hypothetical protein